MTWTSPACAPPAEKARSLAVTATTLALHVSGGPGLAAVGGHATDGAGRVLVPTSPDCRVLAAVAGRARAARAVLTDVAPLPVRERVRGRLELHGRLTVPPPAVAAQDWERATGRPLEPGRRVLRLSADTVRLDGTEIEPQAYARAEPDPMAPHEAEVLSHLAAGHAAQTARLAGLLPRRLLAGAVRVVPLRLDRHALVLRVERVGAADTDVPIALTSTRAEHPGQVLAALRALLDTATGAARRR